VMRGVRRHGRSVAMKGPAYIFLLLGAVLALAPIGCGQLSGPDETPDGYIQVEVNGTLICDEAGQTYVSVKRRWVNKMRVETRVWFRLTEGEWRYWVNHLPGLNGQQVAVRGRIAQIPEGTRASIPPNALYFLHGFEIETPSGKLK
jgi:hypothetical protein